MGGGCHLAVSLPPPTRVHDPAQKPVAAATSRARERPSDSRNGEQRFPTDEPEW